MTADFDIIFAIVGSYRMDIEPSFYYLNDCLNFMNEITIFSRKVLIGKFSI